MRKVACNERLGRIELLDLFVNRFQRFLWVVVYDRANDFERSEEKN
jgi:hypothetical protein